LESKKSRMKTPSPKKKEYAGDDIPSVSPILRIIKNSSPTDFCKNYEKN